MVRLAEDKTAEITGIDFTQQIVRQLQMRAVAGECLKQGIERVKVGEGMDAAGDSNDEGEPDRGTRLGTDKRDQLPPGQRALACNRANSTPPLTVPPPLVLSICSSDSAARSLDLT